MDGQFDETVPGTARVIDRERVHFALGGVIAAAQVLDRLMVDGDHGIAGAVPFTPPAAPPIAQEGINRLWAIAGLAEEPGPPRAAGRIALVDAAFGKPRPRAARLG